MVCGPEKYYVEEIDGGNDVRVYDIGEDIRIDIDVVDIGPDGSDVSDIISDIVIYDGEDGISDLSDVEIIDIQDIYESADNLSDISFDAGEDTSAFSDINISDDGGSVIGDEQYILNKFNNAHFIYKVVTNAKIDLSKAKEVTNGVIENGYLIWSKKFIDCINGKGANFGDIDLKFAVNGSGIFYVGVFSSKLEISFDAIKYLYFEYKNYTSGDPTSGKAEHSQESLNDLRDVALYMISFDEYKSLFENGAIIDGVKPDNDYYLKVRDVYLFNNTSLNIKIIFAKITTFDPTAYSVSRVLNRRWNPCPNNGAGTCDSKRVVEIEYLNPNISSLHLIITSDDGESSYIKVDDTTEISGSGWHINSKSALNRFPGKIEMGGHKTWSQNQGQFCLVVAAEDVIIKNYTSSPDQGITKNPPPIVIPIYPGWNKIIRVYDYFEDDNNWQDKWEIVGGNNTMTVKQENGDLKISIPRGDSNYGHISYKLFTMPDDISEPKNVYLDYQWQITANGKGGNYLLYMNDYKNRIDIGVDTDDVPYINFKLVLNGKDAGNQNIESSTPYLGKLLNMRVIKDSNNHSAFFNNVKKGNIIVFDNIFKNFIMEFSAQSWKSGDNNTTVDYFDALISYHWGQK